MTTTETQAARIAALEAEIAKLRAAVEKVLAFVDDANPSAADSDNLMRILRAALAESEATT